MWKYTVEAKTTKQRILFFTGAGWSEIYDHAQWFPVDELGFALDDAIARGWKIKLITRRRKN